jgi:hypothetical protein
MTKPTTIYRRALPTYLMALCSLFAIRGAGEEESADIRPLRLRRPESESLNRFSLGYQMGFNIKTSFRNFGSFANPFTRRTLDGDLYNYDNGYVFPDSGTVNSGLTHYWGYQGFTYDGSSQLPGNGTIQMQRARSRGLSSGDTDDSPYSGVELTYQRQLGRTAHFRWGVESALNYMSVSVQDDQPLRGHASLQTDAFSLLVPENELPPAPYTGRKSTPGVVIGATPSGARSSIPELVTGSRQLNADLFGFRAGPYLEIPLSRKWSVALSAGLSLADINSDFRYTQTIQTGAETFPTTRGSSSHSDLLAGWYAQGKASYALTKATGLFASVQFQDLGQYSHTLQGKEAVLDLSKSVFVTLGLSYSF